MGVGTEGNIPRHRRADTGCAEGCQETAVRERDERTPGERDQSTDIPQEQKTVPDLSWMYPPGKGNDEDHYRTGGKKLAPPITLKRSTSFQDRRAEEAEKRGIVAQPEVWKTVADSKRVVVNEMLTGNRALPTTYWNYHTMWRQIIEWGQRTRRGGFASRNWLRMEFKTEGWAGGNKSDPLSPGWLIAGEVKAPASPGWTVVGSPAPKPGDGMNSPRGTGTGRQNRKRVGVDDDADPEHPRQLTLWKSVAGFC